MRRRVVVAAVAGILIAMVGGGSASASAGDPEVDPQVAAMLAEVPGGVLVDSHHAAWPGLDMEFLVPRSSEFAAMAAVGSCPDGYVCVFSGSALGGSVLRWVTCGYHAIPASFTARSIADARGSGSAQARSGTTVLATAPAGGWAAVTVRPDNVLCVF